jgi:branched-chain amino acid transport system ATP-binding protein
MSLLEVEHLVVEHGRLRALWDVSLAIEAGDQMGLLGANGAGKSTTLGAIVGLYPAAGGDIRFAGESIRNKPIGEIIARGVVLVPEGRRLFGDMTVRENLMMGAYLPAERKHVPQRLDEVFALFPVLRDKAAQAANTLSGGQQQMVAIGRALMARPRLLLLDEPFIGVAPLVIEEVMAVLHRVAADGMTILLVEQNIHRALDFVRRAYVVENGRTVLSGSREQLLGDRGFGSKFLGLD